MNWIWFGLIVGSVVSAAFSGRMADVTAASIDSAKAAVTLAIGLIGVMAFWLGMMRIVQAGGFLHTLARWLRPLMVRLFPEVPADHPAMSAMIMNMASNMLGLGNAATPFGIKAMLELDRLNPHPGTATNAMVLFLAINTSNVALAPLGVIALRASLGSDDAAGIWLPTLLATSFSTLVGILAAKLLQRLPMFAVQDARAESEPTSQHAEQAEHPEHVEPPNASALGTEQPTSAPGCAVAVLSLIVIGLGFVFTLGDGLVAGAALGSLLRNDVSSWLLPVLIVVMLGYGVAKRVAVYDAMIEGAKEGFQIAIRIIPFLVAIIVAAGMFRASGLLDALISVTDPVLSAWGFPAEALPMAILRPLSGSGAYAIMAEIMQAEGPDSLVGYLVSTLQGSTETTFYVLAVYFGAIGVTRVRHALAAGLTADVAGVVGAVVAVNWLLVG
jgi:spore maturation protein SpmA